MQGTTAQLVPAGQASTSADHTQLEVQIWRMAVEADGVLSFELRATDGGPLPRWAPGAHIDVHVTGKRTRQYSLCGDPREAGAWRLGVLHEDDHEGTSHWLHTVARPGMPLTASAPRNNFPLGPATAYRLIAGGIGVTPLLPMVRELARRGADWRLLYGGRSRLSMAFVEELAAHGPKVLLCPQDTDGLPDLAGFLGGAPDAEVYCCGPEGLLGAVAGLVSEPRLHIERFRPAAAASDAGAKALTVRLKRSGLVLSVPPEQSILDAVEDAGVLVASSCREGTCGTCESNVLAGVPDHRDSLLTAAERESGKTLLICVSRACTDELVLDL